ncbi:MAG: DNA repair protein RecO [Saprospiraceae bacterium]|nr:DNA repair protein RecO [Saprospiraceae bacterium]
MVVKTRGIVLRAIKYSETSVIVDIFTEQFGLRSYIISGVRTSKSKVAAGLLQVMSLVDIVAYEKAEKLNRLTEIRAAHVYTALPFDMTRMSVGLFMTEVAQRTIKGSEENRPLFNFLFDVFKFLDMTDGSVANLHLAFLVELSGYFGFRPEVNEDEYYEEEELTLDLREGIFLPFYEDEEEGSEPLPQHFLKANLTTILREFLKTPWHESANIKMNRDERRALITELLRFYQWHLEGFPDIQSFKILQEIM